MSSYRDNRPTHAQTHPPTHKQTGPITIHGAVASLARSVNILAFIHSGSTYGNFFPPLPAGLMFVTGGQRNTTVRAPW